MICPDLVTTDVWAEPPSTKFRSISVVPIVDQNLETLGLLVFSVHHFPMVLGIR
jgi:hypothetical protein